ncbi:zinc finger CCCH domain-containing protein 3 [Arctopsyche grandis]|uniref:zinc finger CCCH domain-containing protein 3 n=1 Tax=Arctopsyche grandis TaxID=121162 RepID=UPI00406D99E5
MEPKRHLTTAHDTVKANCVYINPNFKNRLTTNEIVSRVGTLPHINPNFKKSVLSSDIYNRLETQFHNDFHVENHEPRNIKIHFNPKMLASMKKKAEEQHIINSDISTVAPPKNKFSKVNPRNTETNTKPNTSLKIIRPPPMPVVPRKPSHSLIRKAEPLKTAKVLPSSLSSNNNDFHTKTIHNNVSTKKIDHRHRDLIKMKRTALKKVNKVQIKPKLNTSTTLNSSIVFIDGEKFTMSDNKLRRISQRLSAPDSLAKITRRICVKGKTFVRKSISSFVLDGKDNPSPRMLKKVNVTCPIYRHLGVCVRHQKGKCSLLHDPKHIAICRKFLQGDCQIDGCHLSHNVSLEKMPICKYFLEGCCARIECPYLHVKMSDNANICNRFLQGFCDAGKDCNDLHMNVCPNFYKTGKCDKVKCSYPHKSFATKKPSTSMYSKSKENKATAKSTVLMKDIEIHKCDEAVSRYYSDGKSEKNVSEIVCNVSDDSLSEKISPVAFNERPKIGNLPSYIAI